MPEKEDLKKKKKLLEKELESLTLEETVSDLQRKINELKKKKGSDGRVINE